MKKMGLLYGLAAIAAVALMVFVFRSIHASPGSDIQNDLMKKAASPAVWQEVTSRGIAVYSRRESFMVEGSDGVFPAAGRVVPPVDMLKRCYALAFQGRWDSAVSGNVTVRIDTSGSPYSPVSPKSLVVTQAEPETLRDEALVECIRGTAPHWYIDRELRMGQVITGELNLVYGKRPVGDDGRKGGKADGAGTVDGVRRGVEGDGGQAADAGGVDGANDSTAAAPGDASASPSYRELVQQVFKDNHGQLLQCYREMLLRSHDKNGGNVALRLKIAGDGKVIDVKTDVVDNWLTDKALKDCILDRVRKWRFHERADGNALVITHVVAFSPAN